MEKNRFKTGLAFVVVLFLGISGALSLYFYKNFIATDLFMPGVEIGGIAVQGYNVEDAASTVSQAINETFATPVTFYKDDYKYESTLGGLCLSLDVAKIVESAWKEEKSRNWQAKIANLDGNRKINYPLTIQYNPEVKARLLKDWDSKWGVVYKNASLEVDNQRGLVIVPGQAGLKVDEDATFKILPTNLHEISTLRMPIIMVRQQPQVNEEMLKNMGEISSYSTFYNPGEVNRSHNLYMAASSVNKIMIAPQTVFSFNNTVGARTMETGYLDALVIVGNKFEPGLGGGICQVSSTLYNACLLAGLEIVERYNHALAVAYVPLGRDATVAYGIQDLKIRNSTDSPVYIRVIASGGKLTVNIYGNLKYKRKIDISNIIDQTLDFVVEKETDPKMAAGEQRVDHKGNPGYIVRSFRNFYDENGKIVKTEQLARDTYKPLNELILEGPAIAPSVPGAAFNLPASGSGVSGTTSPGSNTPAQTVVPLIPGDTSQNSSNPAPLRPTPIKP